MSEILIIPSAAGANVANMADCAEQAAKILGKTGSVFRKGGHVLRLVGDTLTTIKSPAAHSMIFNIMNVQKWSGRGQNVVLMPAHEIKDSVLNGILGSPFIESHIPPVAIVVQRPFMILSDSKLITLKTGYNSERGGILVTGSQSTPEVPVAEAVESLRALFGDFSFASPSDFSRAIAAVFVAAMRIAGIYERHPLLVFEADSSQAGKTLMWSMICAIFGQRFGTVAQKRGGVGSLDESLMEKLVGGNAFILLDNLRGPLDSAFLEACLTLENGSIDARVAGIRAIPVDPRLVTFGLTSNGVELTIDLSNRSLLIRIRKQPGLYAFRKWTDGAGQEVDIRHHIESRQAYYQGCVNAVLRDWWEAGAKRLPCTEHSFRETMGALDHISHHYFGLAPLLDGHRIELERTTKPALGWLRQIAHLAADGWGVVQWNASRLAEKCELEGITIPGKHSDTDSAARQVGILMASAFGGAERITIDGIEVIRTTTTDEHARERKTYSFQLVAP